MQLVNTDLPLSLYYALSGITSLPLLLKGWLLFKAALLCMAQAALISTGASYIATTIPFCLFALYFTQKFYLKTSCQLRFLGLEAKSPLYTLDTFWSHHPSLRVSKTLPVHEYSTP